MYRALNLLKYHEIRFFLTTTVTRLGTDHFSGQARTCATIRASENGTAKKEQRFPENVKKRFSQIRYLRKHRLWKTGRAQISFRAVAKSITYLR